MTTTVGKRTERLLLSIWVFPLAGAVRRVYLNADLIWTFRKKHFSHGLELSVVNLLVNWLFYKIMIFSESI